MMRCAAGLAGLMLMATPLMAGNLINNGSFDAPGNPLEGWNTDYAWTGNSHYVGNASRVRPVEAFAGQRHAVKLMNNADAGTKLESMLIPFKPGERYRATLKVQGGRYRIYFSGYQWKPGIRPHDSPTLADLRPLYRSKAVNAQSPGWTTVSLEIPGTEASDLSLRHLNRVRFITLYLWFQSEGHVDDVQIVRIN